MLVTGTAVLMVLGDGMYVVTTWTGVVLDGGAIEVVSTWTGVLVLVGAEPQPWSPGQRAFLQSKLEVDEAEVVVAELD